MTNLQNGRTDVRSTSKSWTKFAGIAVLGLGVVLGGCNNKVKEENEALRTENAAIKERLTSAEMQAQQAEANANNANQQISALQAQVAAARTAPAPTPPSSQDFTNAGAYPPVAGGGYDTAPRSKGNRSGGNRQTFELAGDVSFGSGQATLKPEARRELDTIASRLRRDYPNSDIMIEGHTDSDPVRKSKYGSNDALSKARADAVRDYLVKKGISRSRIDTVGKGSREPKGSKAASRRVEIVVVD